MLFLGIVNKKLELVVMGTNCFHGGFKQFLELESRGVMNLSRFWKPKYVLFVDDVE